MKYLILLVVFLANFWVWRIIQYSTILALLLLILSLLTFRVLQKPQIKLIIFTAIISLIITLQILSTSFDQSLVTASSSS